MNSRKARDEAHFLEKHPITLSGVIYTSLDFKAQREDKPDIPYPTIGGMKGFARYSGFSYGSLRTTVSQWKKYGIIKPYKDGIKIRYRLISPPTSLFAASHFGGEDEGKFTLAVFSFAGENQSKRYAVRQVLKYAGFKMLAKNAYMGGQSDRRELRKMMEKLGVGGKCHFFECSFDEEDTSFISKARTMWNVDGFDAILRAYRDEMNGFLNLDGLSAEQIYYRIHYAACYFYEKIFPQRPKLPKRLLRDANLLSEIVGSLRDVFDRHIGTLESYFTEANT